MLRKVLRIQALTRKPDMLTDSLNNCLLQQLTLRLEGWIHLQSVVSIDRKQPTIERSVMGLT